MNKQVAGKARQARRSSKTGISRMLSVRWQVLEACWVPLLVWSLLASTAAASELKTNAPLYLLSYDHGGLILWGTEHFAERLRDGIAWLERYPDFKLGLDNEASVSSDPRDAHSPFVHGQKLRLKLFPAVDATAIGVRDLPFAVSETTNRYVEGNYWTAVTDSRIGLAFFNRGTMGTVREDDGGFSLPLAYAMYYIWGTRMLTGDFSYEFAIEPFIGAWPEADLHRKAVAYNFPIVSTTTVPGTGLLGETLQPLRAGSDHIILSALYPENGQVYMRLYECDGRKGESPLEYWKAGVSFWETDLLGRSQQRMASSAAFGPWQFRTFTVQWAR